ncbi:bifunctional DNA primase/polymerase [Streptomyces roseifaciens]|uniref:bifunctional DNA primase/polymerase n=1 Tax=Streptomyces roseifaciens TaxID=1488406 RepID=UPI000717F746|nr:bifunctional DNA primase/polymerase [Streptomyces roseifaciens]
MSEPLTVGFPHLRLLAAALDAALRDWHVFPLLPESTIPALHDERSCPGAGPCAGGHLGWEARSTVDPDRITGAWTVGPYNVGIATGPSRLAVLDLDPSGEGSREDARDGAAALTALCEGAGHPVPATYQVRTAHGGLHLYFTVPTGTRLNSSCGGPLIPGVRVRAWGGYAVAPGSIAPAGVYHVVDGRDPVPLPDWLLRTLTSGVAA